MDPSILASVLDGILRAGLASRYAIGGAVAAIHYMEPFLTYDVDVFLDLPESPAGLVDLGPLYAHLQARGYRPQGETVMIDGIPVQFLPVHEDLLREAVREAREVGGGDKGEGQAPGLRIMRAEHLLAVMLRTGRPQDRVRFQKMLTEATPDRALLKGILERHGLRDTYLDWGGPPL
ncbi:MAG: hypothetical protein HY608_00895 [Planctomycetes bacterium]|nr:hypothetical protein [Planctomycetota bacterium]